MITKTLDDIKGYVLSQLSERSAINYGQVLLLVEKYLDKPIYEVNSEDAELLKKNLERYGNIVPGSRTLSETTRHFYIRVLMSVGKKMQKALAQESQLQQEYKKRYGTDYKSPFGILDDKIQFHHVVGKREQEFPLRQEIEEFLQLFFGEDSIVKKEDITRSRCQERLLVAMLYYCGFPPRMICNMKFEDFKIKENEIWCNYIGRKENLYLPLHPVVTRFFIDYLMCLLQNGKIRMDDYVFRNRSGNPYNLKNISSVLLSYSKKISPKAGITSGILTLIADARKYLKNLQDDRVASYYQIPTDDFQYFGERLTFERMDNRLQPEHKIYMRALEYVMEEKDKEGLGDTDFSSEFKFLERVLSCT